MDAKAEMDVLKPDEKRGENLRGGLAANYPGYKTDITKMSGPLRIQRRLENGVVKFTAAACSSAEIDPKASALFARTWNYDVHRKNECWMTTHFPGKKEALFRSLGCPALRFPDYTIVFQMTST